MRGVLDRARGGGGGDPVRHRDDGLSAAQLEELCGLEKRAIVYAPNMSRGVNLRST